MAATTMIFPKEFERSFFRDLNKEMLWIFLICYAVSITACFTFAQLDWKGPSQDQLEAMKDRLHDVPVAVQTPVAPPKQEQIFTEAPAPTAGEERQADIASRGAEKVELSAAERASRRAAAYGARSRAAGAGISAAQSIGIFARAGAGGGGGGGTGGFGGGGGIGGSGGGAGGGMGGRGSGAVAGLSSGAGSGADINKLSGLGVSGEDIAKAQRIRGSGKLIEGGGGPGGGRLNLSEMKPEDIEALIKRASVKVVSAPVIAGSDKAKGAKGRSASEISTKISGYSNQIKACFQQYLRQDPNLAGSLGFQLTIKPNGSVSAVKITSSEWSDSNLGRRVESCVRERVMSWRFDQIDAASGDLSVNYSYVFSR